MPAVIRPLPDSVIQGTVRFLCELTSPSTERCTHLTMDMTAQGPTPFLRHKAYPWDFQWDTRPHANGRYVLQCCSYAGSATGRCSNKVEVKINNPVLNGQQGSRASLSWESWLEVPEGAGRIVVNDQVPFSQEAGRTWTSVAVMPGAVRVEASLVVGAGPGVWRFSLFGSLKAGSLRVLQGQPALVTEDGIVFRMRGEPGEKVAFSLTVE